MIKIKINAFTVLRNYWAIPQVQYSWDVVRKSPLALEVWEDLSEYVCRSGQGEVKPEIEKEIYHKTIYECDF